ncbi:MAG: DUF1737 domain-containing protein [Actinomycetota bacterium]
MNDTPTDDRDDGSRLRYRLLTGPDDHEFCVRVSRALDDGYVLHGSPSIANGPEGPVVCQAVVLS